MMTLHSLRPVAFATISLLVAALSGPNGITAQGVRGGADSVRVRIAGVEWLAGQDTGGDAPVVEIRVAIEHAADFHSWPDEPVVPAELKGLNPIATSIEPSWRKTQSRT